MTTGLRTKTAQDSDWHLEFSDVSAAWALSPPRPEGKQQGEGVIVVHPDTGYTEHPELMGPQYKTHPEARNFYLHLGSLFDKPSDRMAIDDLSGASASHGTKTASVLVSGGGPPNPAQFPNYNASKAIWGVAPKAEVLPYRVTNWVNLTDRTTLALARAILYAATKEDTSKVGVMSISLGRTSAGFIEGKSKMIDALKQARKKGIIVCAAAGQLQQSWAGEDMGNPAFPGRDPNAICVAGCKPDGSYTPIPSGFLGSEVDITAPAFDLWVAKAMKVDFLPAYTIEQSWGTSYATAITAGACALWQAYHGRSWLLDPANYGPELIFPLFKCVLKRSSFKPQGWDSNNRGYGVLDAKALLQEPLPSKAEIEALDEGEDCN